MKKEKWLRTCFLLVLLLVFPAFVAFAASSQATANWNDIVAKAKEEGKIVMSTSNTPVVRQAIAKGFKDAYGIDIEFIGGGKGSELGAKLLSERQAGMFVQDIFIGGTTTILTALKPAGAIDPLEPALMQQEVLDKKLWMNGDYLWADRDRRVIVLMLMPNSGQSCIINTTMAKPDEIKVFDDFLNAKWRGRIVLNDPTVQGPGLRFVGVTADKIKGWDYMKELVKQKPEINRDQRLQVEWVARGKHALGLGMEPNLITEFLQAGTPILEVLAEDDFTASAGPNDLALVNRAAHPNAARVFINWILGREGQTIMSKAGGLASVKTNVPTEHLTPVRRLDRSKKYFIVDHEDFILREKEFIVKSKEIFGGLLK